MSIIESFDGNGEEIITPDRIIMETDDIPERLLAVFGKKFSARILERFDCLEVSVRSTASTSISIYGFEYKGKQVGFYLSPMGGATAVGVLEEIAFTKKHKLLFFGSCGSLDSEISSGHLLVPTAAYRDEGTSYHYAPPSDYIEIKTAERLAAVFDEIGVPYRKTKVWTTDAIYRETRRNMLARKSEGCAAVDMECASLMACAQFRRYEVYQFLYAADCLDGESWDKRILGSMELDMRDEILNAALETIIRL